jgi:hypothetical protein
MKSVKAHVRQGRLVLDAPTDLPEGAEVELVAVDWDDLDEEDRQRLHAALEASEDDLEHGRMRSAEAVLADLERPSR